MTDAPDLEPTLERDLYEVANQLEGYVGPDTPEPLAQFLLREGREAAKLADEIVRLRAARSAPEAGKAVDETAHDLVMRSVSLLSSLLIESPRFSTELNDKFFTLRDDMRQWLINQADAALASSPAPTGAEPTQAVPAEDVAKIEPALLKLSKVGFGYDLNPHDKWALKQAATALTSISAERDDAIATVKLIGDQHRKQMEHDGRLIAASEAEAADLRRKLEEAERIGKMMANAIYNVHQRGLHVNADDMDSLKECQEAWDRALRALESDNG